MAALLLSAVGSAAGGGMFGAGGAMFGRMFGSLVGNLIDRSLFGSNVQRTVEDPRLSDLEIMTSTEGAPIARAYGRVRLSGQLIWATKLEEIISTRRDESGGGIGSGGGQGVTTTTTTTYSYFANLAVRLCEGAIGNVMRVWDDGKPLDLNGLTVRVYTGTEDQTPDPLIVAKVGSAPAVSLEQSRTTSPPEFHPICKRCPGNSLKPAFILGSRDGY